jgi:cbb3-type cytochrome oxidase subunit 1
MGMTHDLQYAPVHAHINLLGWATLALAGILYHLFPQAGGSRLGLTHFWLHNLALPPLMLALFLMLGGNQSLEPVVGLLSLVMVLALLTFAVNLFLNMSKAA